MFLALHCTLAMHALILSCVTLVLMSFLILLLILLLHIHIALTQLMQESDNNLIYLFRHLIGHHHLTLSATLLFMLWGLSLLVMSLISSLH
ncbi:hypothetical protein Lal_00035325, partial [Lupinus albus]